MLGLTLKRALTAQHIRQQQLGTFALVVVIAAALLLSHLRLALPVGAGFYIGYLALALFSVQQWRRYQPMKALHCNEIRLSALNEPKIAHYLQQLRQQGRALTHAEYLFLSDESLKSTKALLSKLEKAADKKSQAALCRLTKERT